MKSGFNRHMVWGVVKVSIGICLISVFLVGMSTSVSAASMSISYDSEGNISADVSKGTLHNVLNELSQKTGITIFLDTSLKSKKISATFKKLALDQGIKKLISPYSSAIIYGKRIGPDGKDVFFVSELRVFEKGKEKAIFVRVGDTSGLPVDQAGNTIKATDMKTTNESANSTGIPERLKDPARAAEHHKKAGAASLRARISRSIAKIRHLKNKMRYEEEQKRYEIQEYEAELQEAPENEARIIQSKLNLGTIELRAIKKRNSDELNRLQRELNQLKRSQVMVGSASAKAGK